MERTRRKGWYVKQSFSNDFVDLMATLYDKYGEDVFAIQGIANKHLDLVHFSKEFFTKSGSNVADISVDGNANVKEKNITQYNHENNKSLMKLNSLYLLYKYVRDIYSPEDAAKALEKVVSGEVFVNDLTNYGMPYCFAFDLRNLITKGMDFFQGNMTIKAPKRSGSFLALLIQTTAYISNQIMGACSYPDFFVILDWYYRKEFGEDYVGFARDEFDGKSVKERRKGTQTLWYIIQNQFQHLVYSLNYPFRGNQSAFTNLSVMDTGFLKSLFKDYYLPENEKPHLKSILELSKLFFEYYTKINGVEGMFTFPVMTIAASVDDKGKYIDKSFVKWAAKANSEKSLANIFQDKPTSFSSCCRLKNDFSKISETGYQNSFGVGGVSIGCYDEETEVLTEEGWMKFKYLIDSKDSRKVKVLTKNPESLELEWQLPTDYMVDDYKGEMHHYKRQGLDLLVTPNHNMSVVSRKTGELKLIKSEDLRTGYNLPRLDAINNMQDKETIKLGETEYNADGFCKLFGAYLGDGATYHNIEEAKYRAYEISFQVSKNREIQFIESTLKELNISYNKTYIRTRGSWNIRFYSKDFWEFVKPLGKTSDKYIPETFIPKLGPSNLSCLLDGLLYTDGMKDGSNGTWFYSTSKKLADNVTMIAALLGIPTNVNSRIRKPSWLKRDGRYIYSKRPQYEVKLLTKDKVFDRICKSKKEVQYDGKIYCVEVPNHILFIRRKGKTAWCGNSHRVAGVNLPRIALLEKDNPKLLEEDLDVVHKILYSHRKLIQERVDGGYLPLYTHGWIHLSRQYSTVGVVGAYEYLENKKKKITTEKGLTTVSSLLQRIEKHIVKWQQDEAKERNIYNIEQIPAESMAVRLAEIDTILGYNPNSYKLYSNQYIPLINEANIYDRLKIQGTLDKLTSGGAILHLNVDDEKPITPKQFENLMDWARQLGVVYFAINYAYSECVDKHLIIGKVDECSVCGNEISTQYTRVVGFLTPVRSWNKTRREYEFPNRKFYRNGGLTVEGKDEIDEVVMTTEPCPVTKEIHTGEQKVAVAL